MSSLNPLVVSGFAALGAKRRPVVFGNFEMEAALGRGGMATVYRAKERFGPRQGWTVAVKCLRPELSQDSTYVDLFETEAAIGRYLHHPHIVELYDAGFNEGVYYLVMEYVDGYDLAKIIERCRALHLKLPVDFAVYLVKTLLEALSATHHAVDSAGNCLGIVHCDVSPSNIFISSKGDIKLGDFGAAHATQGDFHRRMVAGKPHYVSPELIQGTVTPDADLWASTAILYELLTTQRPFAGQDAQEVLSSIADCRFQPLQELRQDISPDLAAVVERAFSKRVEQRFCSATQYASVLAKYFDERIGNDLAIAAMLKIASQRQPALAPKKV